MHYAHLNFCFVLTAAMRGLGKRFGVQKPPRATHTQHFTNNNTITSTYGLHPTPTKQQLYRSPDHHVPQHKTIVHGQLSDRPCTRGSAPGPRWGRCPQTPVFSRFALVICRLALYAVLSSSTKGRHTSNGSKIHNSRPPTFTDPRAGNHRP